MNLERKEAKLWASLNAAAGIGPARFHQVLKGFPTLDAALGAGSRQWTTRAGIPESAAGEALRTALAFDADKELDLAERLGARLLSFRDAAYPSSLSQLPQPPPLLYVIGELPAEGRRSVAVVGTRKPSDYGRRMAREFSAELARAGLAVVSGLARGIDTDALSAVVEAGGTAVGVLGSGLAEFYPRENAALARRMASTGGAVVSQFPLKAGPERFRFPMRNGVISGLSSGVLVVEGEEDSGSLITAQWALEQGREVFALPGRADEPAGRGPNKLIQQGAKLVLSAQDLLAEFPEAAALRPRPVQGSRAEPELYGAEALLYKALKACGPCRLEQLGERTGLAASELGAALTMLEIKGIARSRPGALVEMA